MDMMPSKPMYEQVDSLHFEITGEDFQAFRRWATAIDQRVRQEQLAGQFLPAGLTHTRQSWTPEKNTPTTEIFDKIFNEICQSYAQETGMAYYGAGGAGEGYRFIFSPSNIGTGIEAENVWTGERIHLTKDANW
jgi:hypothetical protein